MNLNQLREMCPESIQKLNPHVFGQVSKPEDSQGKKAVMDLPKSNQPAKNETEADLQAACEQWLLAHGYGRRAPKTIQRHETGKWFVHIHKAKQNPILLDLLLLNSREGAYLEIELKVEGGRLSPDQRAIVLRKEGCVCWSFEQFTQAVLLWEQAIKRRTANA